MATALVDKPPVAPGHMESVYHDVTMHNTRLGCHGSGWTTGYMSRRMATMPLRTLTLSVLPETFAVCRLGPGEPMPDWALIASSFLSLTRTSDELSIVCPESAVPAGIQCEGDWRALKIDGPLDFAETGILASLSTPLADVGVSVFAVSTFDTDYVLVKQRALEKARSVLTQAGHRFV